jgi:hypothetical protein
MQIDDAIDLIRFSMTCGKYRQVSADFDPKHGWVVTARSTPLPAPTKESRDA